MKTLTTCAILLNIAALVILGWFRFKAEILAPMSMAARFTELDRKQIINDERLAAAFPELAKNRRFLVPEWLGEPVVDTARSAATWGLVVAGLNIVSLRLHAVRSSRVAKKKVVESDGGS